MKGSVTRKGKGWCFGCGKKLILERSWCHTKDQVGCRPSDWDGRELYLQLSGNLERQRTVPAGDVGAFWEAAIELQAIALAAPSYNTSKFRKGYYPGSRPLGWDIWSYTHGDQVTLVLDCHGHADQRYVSRGTACSWEPLAHAPTYERSGPPAPPMADDDEGHYNHTPTLWERLANGFAMLDGFESTKRRKEG